MKSFLISVSVLALLTAPAMAEKQNKNQNPGSNSNNSSSASSAASLASGGYTGGNSFNFGGSKIPNNTPDVVVSPGSVSGSDCQLPGFAIGGAIVGNGAALALPGGPNKPCELKAAAEFRMKTAVFMLQMGNKEEAMKNVNSANELMCEIPDVRNTNSMCKNLTPHTLPSEARGAPVNASVYTRASTYWYCQDPAGYYPTVGNCYNWQPVFVQRQ